MSEFQLSLLVFFIGLAFTIATIVIIYVGNRRWKNRDPYDNEV